MTSHAETKHSANNESLNASPSQPVPLTRVFERTNVAETERNDIHTMNESDMTQQPQQQEHGVHAETMETADLHGHGEEYQHNDSLYDPVFKGEEDEAAALEEEANAADYAKEVLGAPGDDEDMSLSGGAHVSTDEEVAMATDEVNRVDPQTANTTMCDHQGLEPPSKRLRL